MGTGVTRQVIGIEKIGRRNHSFETRNCSARILELHILELAREYVVACDLRGAAAAWRFRGGQFGAGAAGWCGHSVGYRVSR